VSCKRDNAPREEARTRPLSFMRMAPYVKLLMLLELHGDEGARTRQRRTMGRSAALH
jgi:hypothetical protein